MKKRRILLITRLRSVMSAAMLSIFLVLGGGALALADGLIGLDANAVADVQGESGAHGVAVTDDGCPVCPHSHHSDADPSCCCGHFHTSPVQAFSLAYVPRLATHEFSETSSYPPEVFFDRFIPPQIHA